MGSMRRAAGRALRLTQASTRTSTSWPRRPLVGGDGEGGLVDQVGLGRHHPELVARVELGRVGDPAATGGRLAHEERHAARLLDQQHVPGEPVALARPAVVAGVGEVAQRQGELRPPPTPPPGRRARGSGAPAPPVGTAVRRPRRADRRPGQSGSKKTVAARDHQPGEHPDREQRPGAEMERHQHHPRGRPRPAPQQQRHDEAVERRAGDREHVGDGVDVHQPPEHRHVGAGREPQAERERAHQPVGSAAWPARRTRRRPPPGSGGATPSRRRPSPVRPPGGRRGSALAPSEPPPPAPPPA